MTAPLCRDCKYAKKHWAFGYEFAKCAISIKNRATGEGWYCTTELDSLHYVCGSLGKLFEPKSCPWWAFWRAP